jgi:hypothetical protein
VRTPVAELHRLTTPRQWARIVENIDAEGDCWLWSGRLDPDGYGNVARGVSLSALNARKTSCKRGHPFSPENTYVLGRSRSCRACNREATQPAPHTPDWIDVSIAPDHDPELELVRQYGTLQGEAAGRQAALAFTRITAQVTAFARELQRAGLGTEIREDPADLLYEAWGLIANAGWDAHRGLVDLEKSPGWHGAAIRWRDRYHAWLGAAPAEVPTEPDTERPTIVVLCGSTRFSDAFRKANLDETLAGRIVLSIGCDMRSDAEVFEGYSDEHLSQVKAALDELHKRKIDLADEVLVLNVEGYVGDSTRSEIDYAITHGKVIRWLEPAAEAERLLAEVSAATPFVACKAPDPNQPGWYCCRAIGHPEDEYKCLYVPVEKIPASADDEGDERPMTKLHDPYPNPEPGEHDDEPDLGRDIHTIQPGPALAADETPEHTEAIYDAAAAKLRQARAGALMAQPTGNPIVITDPHDGPAPGLRHAVAAEIADLHHRATSPIVITHDPNPGPASTAVAQAVVDHVQRNVRRGIPPLTGI